eukprot:Gb_05191 [translate_table: standard]
MSMNNVGGGAAAAAKEKPKEAAIAGGDAFGRAVAKIAVGQICETAGFQCFQQSALEALADIAVRYLGDLGRAAHYYANLAGRTDCNVFDVIQAMEDLNSAQGFEGASDVNHSLSSSGTLREIMRYTNRAEEIPFVRPVPRFPVVIKREPTPSFLQLGETPSHSQIPPWLPAFPDAHTYKHTPVFNERKTDPRTDKIEQARQRRKAERSLVNLQQRLASSGAVLAISSTAMEPEAGDMKAKGKRPGENPFLAPPLNPGAKEVSPIKFPARVSDAHSDAYKQVPSKRALPSVLQAFAPAIEAAKHGFNQVEEVDGPSRKPRGQALPDDRPLVHFKFDFGKKAMAAHMALGIKNAPPPSSWFGRDEEKDDKKRRAEQVLKEAMENAQELAQL